MIRDTYSRTLEMLTTNIHRSINIYYVEIVFRKISNEKYYQIAISLTNSRGSIIRGMDNKECIELTDTNQRYHKALCKLEQASISITILQYISQSSIRHFFHDRRPKLTEHNMASKQNHSKITTLHVANALASYDTWPLHPSRNFITSYTNLTYIYIFKHSL